MLTSVGDDFQDNEIDGFSLLYLTEEDIFRMLSGKVGPARKILQYIKKEQQKSNEPEVSRDHIQEDTTLKKMNTEELWWKKSQRTETRTLQNNALNIEG